MRVSLRKNGHAKRIDEIKDHNWINNLEWCTAKYNNNYGERCHKSSISQINHPNKSKKVICIETKTITPSTTSQTEVATSGKVISSVTVNPIPSNYGDATNKTVTAAHILSGDTAIGWNDDDHIAVSITGTMTNNGTVSPAALNAGGSYTIPVGYHNGVGVVTAKSLSSQTGVDTGKTAIAPAQVLTDYQGWVNGTKITGAMANNGAISGTITGLGSVAGDTFYTIPAGYTSGGTVSITSDIETALSAI